MEHSNGKVYDHIIVGAGVSGLYTAYRLLQKDQNHKILILEKLRRSGGRILTTQFQGHTLEYGAMRFEPYLQPCFAALLKELDISTKTFPPYTCPISMPDFNEISFEEIQAIRTYASSLPPAFALLKYALKNILGDQWDVENDDIHDPSRDERKKWLKKEGMFQGRYLRNHGLWDTMAHVLTKNALDYLLHKGTFYHMLHLNPNAADLICFMLDILATATDHLITIEGGTYTLIERLRERVEGYSNVDILYDRAVESYDDDTAVNTNDRVIDVIVRKASDSGNNECVILYKCHDLIFTCQKKGYETIRGFPTDVRKLLDNSVMIVKLFKAFIVFKNPPFNERTIPLANTFADKVPCREVHYGYDADNKTGMVMLYGDSPYINYWRPFHTRTSTLSRGEPECDSNDHLKNHLAHYLRILFPSNKLPMNIVHYGILDWSSDPYGSGVHLWKPGEVSEDTMNSLAVFGKHGRVHVCGETYSTFQGFIEGSLRSVDNMLARM